MRQEIEEFLGAREPEHRYASWDYCYVYFRTAHGRLTDDMEKSCNMLGFYLASWGMLRGSSPLLQRSSRHYWNLIEYVNQTDTEDPEFAQLDVPNYADPSTRQTILDRYRQVQRLLDGDEHESSLTRTTKVMLGIWGNVPAFDRFFCRTLSHDVSSRGYSRLTSRALEDVYRLYSSVPANQRFLKQARYRVLDFLGQPTELVYPIAKLIDMYGFQRGTVLLS